MQVLVRVSLVAVVVLALALANFPDLVNVLFKRGTTGDSCRCFPGDACWPSPEEWKSFNQTLGGKLIATVPIGSVCHNSVFGEYNAAECEALRAAWLIPATHDRTTSSMMCSFFTNRSCDAFSEPSDQCVLGTHVPYAVNATTADDYQKTLQFVRQRNIRLVIRNTGHDYFGRSTGPGALALWTRNNKEIQVIDYDSTLYRGKALRVGAGVQGFEAQQAAHEAGLVVVTGTCPSVGIAGGFTQGAGLSPLSSLHGMSADNVLEWEVVTTSGEHLVATPDRHSDLYWALSGGGGGTFAAVLSMTVRAHPDVPVAVANMTFTYGDETGVSQDVFWAAVAHFFTTLPSIVDTGASVIWSIMGNLFAIVPVVAPGQTEEQVKALLKSMMDKLDESGIPYVTHFKSFPSYVDAASAMIPDIGVSDVNMGGRLIPRSAVSSQSSAAELAEAVRFITEGGNLLFGVTFDVSRFASKAPPNAILPAWRSAIFDAVFGSPTNQTSTEANIIAQKRIVEVFEPKLEALSPRGGAYLNEAPFRLPHWQEAFFGAKYERLSGIKRRYDPDDVLYGITAVGSENWEVRDDGRLCRAS